MKRLSFPLLLLLCGCSGGPAVDPTPLPYETTR